MQIFARLLYRALYPVHQLIPNIRQYKTKVIERQQSAAAWNWKAREEAASWETERFPGFTPRARKLVANALVQYGYDTVQVPVPFGAVVAVAGG
jgi:hypothetical protein